MKRMNEDPADKVIVCRKVTFSCAHRYHRPELTEMQNREIYGADYTEHGSGHNYVLHAFVEGSIHPDTGMVINLRDLDSILKEVVGPLDHHHLNHDVPYFAEVVPTTENIAVFCYSEIKKRLALNKIHLNKVRLVEGPDFWVDCEQESDAI